MTDFTFELSSSTMCFQALSLNFIGMTSSTSNVLHSFERKKILSEALAGYVRPRDYLVLQIKTWHESREEIDILFWRGGDVIVGSDLAPILKTRKRERIISDLILVREDKGWPVIIPYVEWMKPNVFQARRSTMIRRCSRYVSRKLSIHLMMRAYSSI